MSIIEKKKIKSGNKKEMKKTTSKILRMIKNRKRYIKRYKKENFSIEIIV